MLRAQSKHHHTIIDNVVVRINLNTPPPMRGIVMKKNNKTNKTNKTNKRNKTTSSSAMKPDAKLDTKPEAINITISDFQIALTPHSVRPLLRLSTAFATFKHLVASAERSGRNAMKNADSWTPHNEQEYIQAYRRFHHNQSKPPAAAFGTSAKDGLLYTTEEEELLDKQLLESLEQRAFFTHEILDARHQSLKWTLPKAGKTVIPGTRAKIVRRADREYFLTTTVQTMVDKKMKDSRRKDDEGFSSSGESSGESSEEEEEEEEVQCIVDEEELTGLHRGYSGRHNSNNSNNSSAAAAAAATQGGYVGTVTFQLQWSKIGLSIGSNAKPHHFEIEFKGIGVEGTSKCILPLTQRCNSLAFNINTMSVHDDSEHGVKARGSSRSGITNIVDFVINHRKQNTKLTNDISIRVEQGPLRGRRGRRGQKRQKGQKGQAAPPHLHVVARTQHLRIVVVFDRINTLLALVGDIQVPAYESLMQAPGSAAAVAAAHVAEDIDDTASSVAAKDVHGQAYETQQIGLLLGGMELHLDLKTGLLLALPEYISEDYSRMNVILQKCEVHCDIASGLADHHDDHHDHDGEDGEEDEGGDDHHHRRHHHHVYPEEDLVIDIVDFETKNATLHKKNEQEGGVVMTTTATCISEIENDDVDFHVNIVGKQCDKPQARERTTEWKTEWKRDVNFSMGRFSVNFTPSVIASLHRVLNIKSEADQYRTHIDEQKRNQQSAIRTSVEKARKRAQLKLIHHKFDAIDHDGSGELDTSEFLEFIQNHDQERDNMKSVMPCELSYIVTRLVERIDTDGNGSVSWYEFSNSREVKSALACAGSPGEGGRYEEIAEGKVYFGLLGCWVVGLYWHLY